MVGLSYPSFWNYLGDRGRRRLSPVYALVCSQSILFLHAKIRFFFDFSTFGVVFDSNYLSYGINLLWITSRCSAQNSTR